MGGNHHHASLSRLCTVRRSAPLPALLTLLLMPLLLLFILFAAVSPVSAAGGPDEFRLRLVQLVHRHGARSPEVGYFGSGNESLICVDVPCGLLNEPGKKQMFNMGDFLRQRYNGTLGTPGVVATGFLPSVYNETFVYTRSTDMPRTLQSASAVINGLFAGTVPVYPVIHTVPLTEEKLLGPWMLPNVVTADKLGRAAWVRERTAPMVDKIFPTHEDILAVAREVHSEGRCTDYALRVNCAQMLADVAACYEPNGLLANLPLLSANKKGLSGVSAALTTASYSYNPADEMQRQSGSLGQDLMQAMLKNMNDVITEKSTYGIYHYSAHDATIAPFAATLGNNDDNATFSPTFGTTYVVELLDRIVDGKLYVRVIRLRPGLTPESNYSIASWPLPMRCQNSDGVVYVVNATDPNENLCPLSDFTRFVDSTKGTSPLGSCYLTEAMKTQMNCSGSGASSSLCQNYRSACPDYACEKGTVLDQLSKTCVPVADSSSAAGGSTSPTNAESRTDLSGGAIAGITIATFLLGLLIAGLFSFLLYFCVRRVTNNKSNSSLGQP
ncbi:membrane-bound acid phosphatase precursor [Trypanosoma theileri]|uniref:Membrane-bound acid phosphatase n=1 Tax=Trypanosoma theileri TaxID=67003 RepID=A0A1X0NNY4_9TRYP|nr:membrane-bound acid phosphatase precursor [Trypanosoma theileri]ORC85869.1 membrane-bound acid phosphatase precursor [Trypanosoma theileri]